MVIVPQNIADTDDGAPGNSLFIFLEYLGEAAAGIRQNLKISFNKLPRTPIRTKLLEVIPCSVRLYDASD